MEKMNFEQWHNKYCNENIIDINKYCNNEDLKILKKLDIIINEKLLTKREYGIIKYKLFQYYKDKQDTQEERKFKKSLKEVQVKREQYNMLLKKFEKMDVAYNVF